ncbi:5-cytosine rRNA methyltransferase nsun-4-like isoform X1 [Haematobia irritans]|uniref:5-cytosine rRNA methyltransferase nsun-4-like isoform X1 n=1 Tax=Haematobia irritans TaxID=7368 RepID=UPI003F4F71CD
MIRTRNLMLLPKRWKSGKTRWSIQQRKKTNTDRALDNFDDFYGSVFGIRWKNIRAALLTEHKYITMVNNFGDTEKICSRLEMDGAINVKALVQLAKQRLDGNQQSDLGANTDNQMQDRMQAITRKQEEKEIQSLYPENAIGSGDIPQNIDYASDTTTEGNSQQKAGVRISNVAEASVSIDHSRIVDPDHGTGALYDFVPASTIKGMEDWIPESEHYKYYQTTTDFPLKMEVERDFTFPENLSLYTYEMGNCSEFRPPNKCLTGVLSPAESKYVKPGDRVLEACSAPGGKSLLMLQTLYPEQLVCNDIMEFRVNRIRKVMKEYLFDFDDRWEGKRL